MNVHRTALKMSFVGIDVFQSHPDICRLPGGTNIRLSNDRKGHDRLAALAREMNALVGFEAASAPRGRGSSRRASASASILPGGSGTAISPAGI